MTDFDHLRERMVRDQIALRGVKSPHVLRAIGSVPREAFVSADLAEFAYADTPLAGLAHVVLPMAMFMEKDGTFYCCSHCAEQSGVTGLRDRA